MYMGALSSYLEQEYTAGFYTDIESESLPKGLNEAESKIVTQSSIDCRQMHLKSFLKRSGKKFASCCHHRHC